jgi:hypothetical protein
VAARKVKAQYIEPMLLLRSSELPEGPAWVYGLKLDGYRANRLQIRPAKPRKKRVFNLGDVDEDTLRAALERLDEEKGELLGRFLVA